MKQVIIAEDGKTVENVIIVQGDFVGPLTLPDEAYVGPGMVWNGDEKSPVFTQPDA